MITLIKLLYGPMAWKLCDAVLRKWAKGTLYNSFLQIWSRRLRRGHDYQLQQRRIVRKEASSYIYKKELLGGSSTVYHRLSLSSFDTLDTRPSFVRQPVHSWRHAIVPPLTSKSNRPVIMNHRAWIACRFEHGAWNGLVCAAFSRSSLAVEPHERARKHFAYETEDAMVNLLRIQHRGEETMFL